MRIELIVMVLMTIILLLGACSSKPSTPDTPDEVQAGFEDFLKEKQAQDQAQETAIPLPEERPESYEAPKTKLDITIPTSLKAKYGEKLSSCFEGYGSMEEIAAVASWCVTNLAAENEDSSLCTELLVAAEKDKCFAAIAKASADPSYCEKIESGTDRYACADVIAK